VVAVSARLASYHISPNDFASSKAEGIKHNMRLQLDAATGQQRWRFKTGEDEDIHNQSGLSRRPWWRMELLTRRRSIGPTSAMTWWPSGSRDEHEGDPASAGRGWGMKCTSEVRMEVCMHSTLCFTKLYKN